MRSTCTFPILALQTGAYLRPLRMRRMESWSVFSPRKHSPLSPEAARFRALSTPRPLFPSLFSLRSLSFSPSHSILSLRRLFYSSLAIWALFSQVSSTHTLPFCNASLRRFLQCSPPIIRLRLFLLCLLPLLCWLKFDWRDEFSVVRWARDRKWGRDRTELLESTFRLHVCSMSCL